MTPESVNCLAYATRMVPRELAFEQTLRKVLAFAELSCVLEKRKITLFRREMLEYPDLTLSFLAFDVLMASSFLHLNQSDLIMMLAC